MSLAAADLVVGCSVAPLKLILIFNLLKIKHKLIAGMSESSTSVL